jgi:hypothetical protein
MIKAKLLWFSMFAIFFATIGLNAQNTQEDLYLKAETSREPLLVKYEAPVEVPADAEVEYRLWIENPSDNPAYQVQVYAYLDGADFVSASHDGKFDATNNAISWNFRKLNQNKYMVVSFKLRSGSAPGSKYGACVFADAKFAKCFHSIVTAPNLVCNINLPKSASTLQSFDAICTVENTGSRTTSNTQVIISLDNLKFTETGDKKISNR